MISRRLYQYATSSLHAARRSYTDISPLATAPAPEVEELPPSPSLEPFVDSFGRVHDYLRISLTERCNLRCTYCMPAEGAPLSPVRRLLTRAELRRAVAAAAAHGVHKLRLTGGEPTLRKDLPDVIHDLKSIPGIRTISMTSNGLVLTRQLPALQRAGLAAINVSLDSLLPERYERLARRPGLSRVLAGIDLALQLGYRPLKINTVLMKGVNDDELLDFVELTRERPIHVRFIEFMPFSGNAWADARMMPARAALRVIAEKYELTPAPAQKNDTSRMWQVAGHSGQVGFIASMSQPFCGTCNRLRLTADGGLKVCLFGASEVSLRDAMRAGASDERLVDLIRAALRQKKRQHAGAANIAADNSNRPMVLIGG